jgi:hypothetical protein
MFEDQQQKPVEDIFDKVDAGALAQPPVQPVASVQPMMAAPAAAAGGSKVILLTVIIIIAVAVLGSGGYFGYTYLFANKAATTTTTTTAEPITPATETPSAPAVQPEVPVANVAQFDTDKDGLSDAEEIKLGTNPNKNDTDADGLFDADEVNVYKTDPLKSDTDGDSYLDGAEVLSGFNPNGPGKLLDFDKAKAELTK